MLEQQRHQLILDWLDEHRYASITGLSEEFDASESTIRRDIIKLDRKGLLKKIHGGAEAVSTTKKRVVRSHAAGSAFLVNLEKNAESKRQIAKRAVEMCEDGETVIINGGSTTYMMGEFLAGRQVTVLTNSFELAHYLVKNSENQVILTGGHIYRKQGVIVSPFDFEAIDHYHATKMFLGTPGICKFGVMESDPILIRGEQQLMKQAEQKIVLADSTKLGVRSNFVSTPLEDIDILITDSDAPEEKIRFFEGEGIKVEVANIGARE